tara:strand:- start:2186 stop:2758 length:573 start_codon:yes stop_codon:yes gene_type:complete
MARADLTNDLVHWIKGDSDAESFEVLRQIVFGRRLLGGAGHVKGGYRCVCFTEAPEDTFHAVSGRYRPFGIRVSKKWLYAQGGRPVIYQSDAEFGDLGESHRWRHVRYVPDAEPPIDFSWEREWRIRTDELELPPGESRIIVPHASWVDAITLEHSEEEQSRIYFESMSYGETVLNYPDDFYYAISVLNR